MDITYQLIVEKNKKLWYDYYRKTQVGKSLVSSSLWLMWWLIICVSLIISSNVKSSYGILGAFVAFLVLNLAYLAFGRIFISSRLACAAVSKIRDEDNEKNVSLTQTHLKIRTKRTEISFLWEAIGTVEKLDNSLWFQTYYFNFRVPACVFESKEKYAIFCDLAQQYRNQNPPIIRKKNLLVVRIAMWLFPILCIFVIFGAFDNMKKTENEARNESSNYSKEFLKKAFTKEQYAYYQYFSQDFKKRLSIQDWQALVAQLKNNIGGIKEISVLDIRQWYDPNTIRGFFFRFNNNTRGDTDKVILNVLGEKGSIYMALFINEGTGAWRLNGFDIIKVQDIKLKTTLYSTETDHRLFNDSNDPNKFLKNLIME